jgi:peroxin-3
MLEPFKTYVSDRRWSLVKAVTVSGALYCSGRYVIERLEEARDAVMQDKIAREK